MKIRASVAGLVFALAGLAPGQAADDKLYQVAGGNKVDKATLEGWRTWRALACEQKNGLRASVSPHSPTAIRICCQAASASALGWRRY